MALSALAASVLSANDSSRLFPCGLPTAQEQFRLTGQACVNDPGSGGPALGPRLDLLSTDWAESGAGAPETVRVSPDLLEPSPRGSWWIDDTKLFDGRTLTLTTGSILVVGYLSWNTWWKDSDKLPFHAADEGWFGAETYTGGADKASHFFFSYSSAAILSEVYQGMGKPAKQARWLGAGVTLAVGVLVEIGDGHRDFGYSWSDLAVNALGTLAAVELDRTGLDDTFGFRLGWVPYEKPEQPYSYPLAATYSSEIYTADVKLGGAVRRLGGKPGATRFLLASLSYSTKGYRPDYFDPSVQERNLGIELGVNLAEVLRAAGVPEETWWGKSLILFATYYRIPYTSIGWYYDLNHDRWNGPHNGAFYDPRP